MQFLNLPQSFFNLNAQFQNYYLQFPCFPYLYGGEGVNPIRTEPLFETVSSPVQRNSQQKNLEELERCLRELHFDTIHHKKTHWSSQEDQLLERLVQIQKLEWKEIPKHFPDRTQNMCYSRYRRITMGSRDKSWTKEDEEIIIRLVGKIGQKWKLISMKMPKYTPKQIRERYLNYLRPNIVKNDFSLEDDLKICKYVIAHGKHWRRMEELLPGRPQGSIKGRYYGKLQAIIEKVLLRRI